MLLCWLKSIGIVIGSLTVGIGIALLLIKIIEKWERLLFVIIGLLLLFLIIIQHSSLCG